METIFKELSKGEFENLQTDAVLFNDKKTSRKFGVLSLNKHSYKFSWQSDLVKPEIQTIDDRIYAVGIDQNFSIVAFAQNKVLLNIDLTYFFYTTILSKDFIFVCTELEVLVVGKRIYDIVASIGLPDLFVDLTFEDSKIKIICFDQRIVEQELSNASK